MDISDIRNICVVGAGNMGHQISTLCAIHGYKTVCSDISDDVLKKADAFVDTYLAGRVEKNKLTAEQAKQARDNIRFTSDLADALKDADYVIEAAIEVLDIKRKIYADLDKMAPPHAILATNSSAIVSSRIADATGRPEKVVNLHFFNPALVMKLVEVVRGSMTSDNTLDQVKKLARLIGKTPIVSADRPGFIVNRMLNALVVEAARIVEEGVGTIEDVDVGATLGCGHPMGPFELFDYLNAIHLLAHVTDHMADELGERFRLPEWVKDLVREGRTGRESGKGFYDYD